MSILKKLTPARLNKSFIVVVLLYSIAIAGLLYSLNFSYIEIQYEMNLLLITMVISAVFIVSIGVLLMLKTKVLIKESSSNDFKQIESLKSEDILRLVNNKVQESKTHDYKEKFNLKGDSASKEFLF